MLFSLVKNFIAFSLVGLGGLGWKMMAGAKVDPSSPPPKWWQASIVCLWLVILPLLGVLMLMI